MKFVGICLSWRGYKLHTAGKLAIIPTTTSTIAKLTVGKLRAILKYHGFPVTGGKDQLVLRVGLLRNGQRAAVTAREEEQVKYLVGITYKLILALRQLGLTRHTYYKRKFSSQRPTETSFVPPPTEVREASHLTNLFESLLSYLDTQRSQRKEQDERRTVQLRAAPTCCTTGN